MLLSPRLALHALVKLGWREGLVRRDQEILRPLGPELREVRGEAPRHMRTAEVHTQFTTRPRLRRLAAAGPLSERSCAALSALRAEVAVSASPVRLELRLGDGLRDELSDPSAREGCRMPSITLTASGRYLASTLLISSW